MTLGDVVIEDGGVEEKRLYAAVWCQCFTL
jgi:hypothetical protein